MNGLLKNKWLLISAGVIATWYFFLKDKNIISGGDRQQKAQRLFNELKNTNSTIFTTILKGGMEYQSPSSNPLYLELLRKIKNLGYNVFRNELVTQKEYDILQRTLGRPV